MVATIDTYMWLVYCSCLVCSKFLLLLESKRHIKTLYWNLAFLQFLTFSVCQDQYIFDMLKRQVLFTEKVDIDQV